MLQVMDNSELSSSFRQSLQAEQHITNIAEDILAKLKDPAVKVTLKDDIVLTFERLSDSEFFEFANMEKGFKDGSIKMEDYVSKISKVLHSLSRKPELDSLFFEKLPLKYKYRCIKEIIEAITSDAKNVDSFR